jgi:hypothetical protein
LKSPAGAEGDRRQLKTPSATRQGLTATISGTQGKVFVRLKILKP